MFKIIRPVFRFLIVWLLIFNFQRLLFLVHYFTRISKEGKGEFWGVFWHSFRLDVSTIGFIALISIPFYLFYLLSNNKVRRVSFQLLRFQQLFVLLIVCLIHCGEINVYGEWNHKLSTRVFVHLSHPDEVFRTASISNYIFFFLYLVLELAFGIFLFKKVFKNTFEQQTDKKRKYVLATVFCILLAPLSFLAARGGWQPIPITINAAIFSHSPIVNDVSINSSYFFIENFLLYKKLNLESVLSQTDSQKASSYMDSLMAYPKEHSNLFLQFKKPNLVFIVLESWAAEAIGYSGVNSGATPYFDSLIHEGLYFDHFYSGGGTSEVGNSGIFGGIPALPQVSITLYPNKSRKLPSINQLLTPYGYYSSYLFGGDLDYGNIGGFFMDHAFNKVEDEDVFPKSLPRGKLNVYDPDLYAQFLKNIKASPTPFMQCVFTGSTHAPYDIPQKWKGFWKGEESGFMDGLHFSDAALHDFLENCKKEPWFDSTLFVLVADHGRITPKSSSFFDAKFFRVPLLFWGNPIKEEYKGKVVHTIGSHSDLAATLMYQMDIDSAAFKWSKDLMNPAVPQFAMYSSTIGYGYKDTCGEFFYLTAYNKMELNTYTDSLINTKLNDCRMYLRAVWDHFKSL